MDDNNRGGFDAFDRNYLIEMSNTIFDMRREIRGMRDMLDMMFIFAIALTVLIGIVLLKV